MAKHLFCLCGLPKRISENVCQSLQKKLDRAGTFLHLPTGDNKPYYTENYIRHVVGKLKTYIAERHSQLPDSLNIMHTESMDSALLHRRCFLFSRFVSFQPASRYDAQSSMDAASAAVERLKDEKPDKHQFMPPANFYVESQKTAQDVFTSWALGTMSNEELCACFKEKDFNNEKLPGFLTGKMRKKFFVDDRGLVFPPCRPGEEHGNLSIEGESDTFKYLSAFYRFGWLKGAGFHHDVQYPRKRLGRTLFTCSRAGKICCNNESHVNIYLNDVVRLGFK